ncbi:BCCT family transporter [Cytobacillus sp. NJ13]|nr:BCCT family transporter [Cytobacillus sp. NJ13]
MRVSILLPMTVIFFFIIFFGLVTPEAFYNAENAIVGFASKNFGWLFQLSGVVFLFICIYLSFSKYGKVKLGGKDAKPELSNWSWFSITLCAGIGTGILFYGIAEPVTHFMDPPKELGLEPGSEVAATFSLAQTFIHYTFIPYAMYSIIGIGIAFAMFNLKLPYRISSVLFPLFGNKVKGWIGDVIDNLCIFALVGGVAASLGMGVTQIGSGLNIVTGIPTGKGLWLFLLLLIVLTYVISSYTGLHKGIRILSDLNTKLFLALILFLLIFGPTAFILSLGTQSTGHFLQSFFERTLYTSPIDGSEWPRWWPIFYWAVWLAYAPLIGMFIAKISKGRTIKQFMIVNILLPAVFGIVWFSVYGGAAIHLELNGGGIWESIQTSGLEVSLFAFLENFPFTTFMSIVFLIGISISFITLADSMTSTISALSMKNLAEDQEAPGRVKILWGIIMAAITFTNLIAPAGKITAIDATKLIATAAGFPLLFFMFIVAFSTVKMITNYEKDNSSIAEKHTDPIDHETGVLLPVEIVAKKTSL